MKNKKQSKKRIDKSKLLILSNKYREFTKNVAAYASVFKFINNACAVVEKDVNKFRKKTQALLIKLTKTKVKSGQLKLKINRYQEEREQQGNKQDRQDKSNQYG